MPMNQTIKMNGLMDEVEQYYCEITKPLTFEFQSYRKIHKIWAYRINALNLFSKTLVFPSVFRQLNSEVFTGIRETAEDIKYLDHEHALPVHAHGI